MNTLHDGQKVRVTTDAFNEVLPRGAEGVIVNVYDGYHLFVQFDDHPYDGPPSPGEPEELADTWALLATEVEAVEQEVAA